MAGHARADESRVVGDHRDAPRPPTFGEHGRHDEVRRFAAGVGLELAVAVPRLEVVQVELRGLRRAGREVDDGRGRAALQLLGKLLREQEGSDMIHRHHGVEPVGSLRSLRREDACVVDEEVDPVDRLGDASRRSPDVVRARQVGDHDVRACTGGANGVCGGAQTSRIPPEEHHVRAVAAQQLGC
jgi:hypothetical protein